MPPVGKPKGGIYSLPFKGKSSYQSSFQPIDLKYRAHPIVSP